MVAYIPYIHQSAVDGDLDELKELGVYGIYNESYRIIYTGRKLFGLISLMCIIPLCFFLIGVMVMITFIQFDKDATVETLRRTPKDDFMYTHLTNHIVFDVVGLNTFMVIYPIVYFILFNISTCAIVYTIACFYVNNEITFGKVMFAVPKIWKKVMISFVWNVMAILAIQFFTVTTLSLLVILSKFSTVGVLGFGALATIAFVYVSAVWQLSCVVSVLEDKYGKNAIAKSCSLLRGKAITTFGVYLLIYLSFYSINKLLDQVVMHGNGVRSIKLRALIALLCLILLIKFFLLDIVVSAVIYFVCKSHHNDIDKSALSNDLNLYLREYDLVKEKGLQL